MTFAINMVTGGYRGGAVVPQKLPVTATIICRNEEAVIGACLGSLDACAEIIVVDSGSTDGTLAIVRDFAQKGWPIKLMERDWPGYALQKQFALDQATQDWVLSIDADEWLDADLRENLGRYVDAPPEIAGWRLGRVLTLYGLDEAPRATRPEPILRLVRRKQARFTTELLVHEGIVVKGAVRDATRGRLRHERGLRLDAQIPKEIVYARLKAQQRVSAGKAPSVLKLVFNPAVYFFRVYFLHRTVFCGVPGFIHAMTGATYSFMAEALHWQMWREGNHKR